MEKTKKTNEVAVATFIDGKELNLELHSFDTKEEYDDFIRSMVSYVEDKEREVELKKETIDEMLVPIMGEPAVAFISKSFVSITTDNTIAWKENGVITVCSVVKRG